MVSAQAIPGQEVRCSFGALWQEANAAHETQQALTDSIQRLPESQQATLLPLAKLAEDAARLLRVAVERSHVAATVAANRAVQS